jgi:hypothetical protein
MRLLAARIQCGASILSRTTPHCRSSRDNPTPTRQHKNIGILRTADYDHCNKLEQPTHLQSSRSCRTRTILGGS